MSEVARFSFKNESLPSRGKLDRKAIIGLWVLGLLLTGYLYYLYLHHLTHNGASAAARMAAASTAARPAAAPAVAPKPVSPASTANNSSNSVPAKPAEASLGDSLMAVLTPSAKGETIQPEVQTLKVDDKPVTIPAARQTLRFAPIFVHDEAPLTDAQKLALAATNGYLNIINFAFKNPDIFGFAPNERIQDAVLGEPMPVYTIAVADRENYQEGQSVKALLQATNEWIFPVTLSHRVRFMVPVRRVGDDFVVEPCSRSLAIVYQRILERWPLREGYHPQLVMNPNLPHYYFTIPELPDQNLTDTSVMFEFNPTLSPASVMLASWQ